MYGHIRKFESRSCLCRCLLLHRCPLLFCCLLPLLIMLLVIELGSDVMQNIVCNTKSIIFVTVITIPCKTMRKKKNDNKKKVMQKFLEFFYHVGFPDGVSRHDWIASHEAIVGLFLDDELSWERRRWFESPSFFYKTSVLEYILYIDVHCIYIIHIYLFILVIRQARWWSCIRESIHG